MHRLIRTQSYVIDIGFEPLRPALTEVTNSGAEQFMWWEIIRHQRSKLVVAWANGQHWPEFAELDLYERFPAPVFLDMPLPEPCEDLTLWL